MTILNNAHIPTSASSEISPLDTVSWSAMTSATKEYRDKREVWCTRTSCVSSSSDISFNEGNPSKGESARMSNCWDIDDAIADSECSSSTRVRSRLHW